MNLERFSGREDEQGNVSKEKQKWNVKISGRIVSG